MSLDSSLKSAGGLAKHRNVLSRAERIARLSSKGKFDMAGGNPMGLPKVGNRKATAKAKKKEEAAAAEGGEAAPAAT